MLTLTRVCPRDISRLRGVCQEVWIQDRTRLGLRKARARGVRLGRPRALAPIAERRVVSMRAEGKSWGQIAGELGITISSARRAAQRQAQHDAEKGVVLEPANAGSSLGIVERLQPGPETNDFDMENEVAHGDERPS